MSRRTRNSSGYRPGRGFEEPPRRNPTKKEMEAAVIVIEDDETVLVLKEDGTGWVWVEVRGVGEWQWWESEVKG